MPGPTGQTGPQGFTGPTGPTGMMGPTGIYATHDPIVLARGPPWSGIYFDPIYNFFSPFFSTFDGRNIWVSNQVNDTVTALDAITGAFFTNVGGVPYNFSSPEGMAFDGVHIWVVNIGNDTVTALNASDGSFFMSLSGAPYNFFSPEGIVFDGTHLWVSNPGNDTVTGFFPNGTFFTIFATQLNLPLYMTFDGTNIWVGNNANAGADSMSVTAFDTSGAFVMNVSGGAFMFNSIECLAFDGINVWAVNIGPGNGSVTKFTTGGAFLSNITDTSIVDPFGIAFDGANMWVTSTNGGVTIIRVSDDAIVTTYPSNSNPFPQYPFGLDAPFGITYAGKYMWVCNLGNGTMSSIFAGKW